MGRRNQFILVQFLCHCVLLRFPMVQTMMIKYSVARSICYQQKIFTSSKTRKGQILPPLKEPLKPVLLQGGGRCIWIEWEKNCESGVDCSTFVQKSCEELGLAPWTNQTGRIHGGQEIVPDSYPSYGRMWNGEDDEFYGCGFTILNENWGLSAQHCNPGEDNPFVGEVGILVGRHNESIPEEGEQRRMINKYIEYPDKSRGRKKDLLLLYWEEPLKLDGGKAAAVKLTDKPIDEGELTLVGSGYFVRGDETTSLVPREVTIPILPDQKCAEQINAPGVPPEEWLICVTKAGSLLSGCQGDSGGPMYTIGEDKTQYLTGVVSFGNSETSPACGSPTVVTAGVEVYHFLDWIEKEIQNK